MQLFLLRFLRHFLPRFLLSDGPLWWAGEL